MVLIHRMMVLETNLNHDVAQHNKALDASGESVFRKIIGPAMLE
jgi:hypothetical protein